MTSGINLTNEIPMENKGILRLAKTTTIPNPHYYIRALRGEFSDWTFSEEEAPENRGLWRENIFKSPPDRPLDLEIGMGNGYHFSHYSQTHPQRCVLGIEIKYKPLIQSIRRALSAGASNMRAIRYDARFLEHLFAPQELNKVIIHFPDPWRKRHQRKNRLIRREFLDRLSVLLAPEGEVEFKTDNEDYFFWVKQELQGAPYEVLEYTEDLHQSPYIEKNFVTHFEKIFLKKGQPIFYMRLKKK